MWIYYKRLIRRYRYVTTKGGSRIVKEILFPDTLKIPIYETEYYYEWQWFWNWVGKKKYQKKPHHKKKPKVEKEKHEANRRFKNKHKDKKKAGLKNSWSGRGCPKWLKRYCNKKHRQWERQCIKHEKYDRLGSWNHKRKDIFDPWMWD